MSCLSFTSSTVRRLLEWKQGDEDDHWAEKAVSLLVKKLTKPELVVLEQALSSANVETMCVTLDRTLDGRLQVQHRKGLPHVIYCRVWRWPDLGTYHELRAVPSCEFAYSRGKDQVCINPYHYVRVSQVLDLPPVFIPAHNYPPEPVPLTTGRFNRRDLQLAANDRSAPDGDTNHRTRVFTVCHYPEPLCQPAPDDQSSLPAASNLSTEGGSTSTAGADDCSSTARGGGGAGISIQYSAPINWCSIAYFELNDRIGEVFYAALSPIIIDGYTDPTRDDRFCLGHLSSLHRNSTINKTRHHIGDGVQLVYAGGMIFLKCLSYSPIFVQSVISNHINGRESAAVCKLIPDGSELVIFDSHRFAAMLKQSVPQGYKSVHNLTRVCYVKMSFVKGWGAAYHRQKVTDTPCWVEICIHGALTWIDRVLTQLTLGTVCDSNS